MPGVPTVFVRGKDSREIDWNSLDRPVVTIEAMKPFGEKPIIDVQDIPVDLPRKLSESGSAKSNKGEKKAAHFYVDESEYYDDDFDEEPEPYMSREEERQSRCGNLQAVCREALDA